MKPGITIVYERKERVDAVRLHARTVSRYYVEPDLLTSVKRRALETETLFSRAQGTKVLGGLRDHVRAKSGSTGADHRSRKISHRHGWLCRCRESLFRTASSSRHLLHNNAPRGLASNGHIKEALRVGPTIAANKGWINER
jgi:hypothetical protein